MMTRVSAVASATVYAATLLVNRAEVHSMMLDPPSRQGLQSGWNLCPNEEVPKLRMFVDLFASTASTASTA